MFYPGAVHKAAAAGAGRAFLPSQAQPYPEIPNDVTRVFFPDSTNHLVPLPFEPGLVQVDVYAIAPSDRTFYVELKGTGTATEFSSGDLHFYVFVMDRMDPPPHQMVRLTNHHGTRRFRISVEKGRKGFAPFSSETVKLQYRILDRLRVETGKGRFLYVNYMEISPRDPLSPGEYAIIGSDLSDIATFRVGRDR